MWGGDADAFPSRTLGPQLLPTALLARTPGTLMTWGLNADLQLGVKQSGVVKGVGNVRAAAAGEPHRCANTGGQPCDMQPLLFASAPPPQAPPPSTLICFDATCSLLCCTAWYIEHTRVDLRGHP